MVKWTPLIIVIAVFGYLFYVLENSGDKRKSEREEFKKQDSLDRLDPENYNLLNKDQVLLVSYYLGINQDTSISIVKYYEMNTGFGYNHNVDSLLQVVFKKYPTIPKSKIAELILKCE